MPINKGYMFWNPVIPDGFYYVKLLNIELEEIEGYSRPLIHARLKIVPRYSDEINGLELSSIIHTTENSNGLWEAFCNTFMITNCDYDGAVGRFGSVIVQEKKYESTKFGQVSYCRQPHMVRSMCLSMQEEDEHGEIPW
jgi:hypothetical protein